VLAQEFFLTLFLFLQLFLTLFELIVGSCQSSASRDLPS
jgi:hypothetical protein